MVVTKRERPANQVADRRVRRHRRGDPHRLTAIGGVAGLSLDALSSVAYGPEAIVLTLPKNGAQPRALTIAPAGWNVNEVETFNQSGMRSAVRCCPRRAVARAEQTGDNRMSGITMNAPPAPSVLPEGGFLSRPWQGHTARLVSRRLRSSVAVISAHGGIDASNADTLTEYTLGHLTRCRGMILDLRDLDFFGTEGFSALHRVSVRCARVGMGWAVVPGAAVSRVLRIGDPQGLLPAASTVEAAMAIVQGQPHRPPQPVASRRDPGQSSRCERTVCSICGGAQQIRHEQRTLTKAIAKLDRPALTVVDPGVRRREI